MSGLKTFQTVLKVRNDYIRALMSVVIYTSNILVKNVELQVSYDSPFTCTIWGESSF